MRQADLNRLFPIREPLLRGGRWLLGLAILTALLAFFWACGVFSEPPGGGPRPPWGPALFFSVIIAYIVPIFGYISARTVAAVDALAPVLGGTPAQAAAWRERICMKPARWFVVVLLIGGGSGVAHNLLLYGFGMIDPVSRSLAQASLCIGTELIWVTVTLVVAALLDNALLLNRLAHRVRLQPFHPASLRPFAAVAVLSTLALIGAQAAFPIMTLEGGVNPLAYVPGLLATGVPMLIMAALPVWPVHLRLKAAKRQMLSDVNGRIAAIPAPDPDRPESLTALMPLLAYRRELAQLAEWPFDVGVMARLGLYLIIPPLTWVGAALIENLVDAVL